MDNIWGEPKFKEMASQPLGSPIELTQEEAERILATPRPRKSRLRRLWDMIIKR